MRQCSLLLVSFHAALVNRLARCGGLSQTFRYPKDACDSYGERMTRTYRFHKSSKSNDGTGPDFALELITILGVRRRLDIFA